MHFIVCRWRRNRCKSFPYSEKILCVDFGSVFSICHVYFHTNCLIYLYGILASLFLIRFIIMWCMQLCICFRSCCIFRKSFLSSCFGLWLFPSIYLEILHSYFEVFLVWRNSAIGRNSSVCSLSLLFTFLWLLRSKTQPNHFLCFEILFFCSCYQTTPIHRRRMRCSTNIYLTALALADIVNLFCAFILSLQQYPNFNYGHSIFWSAIGLSHWFHDASRMLFINWLRLFFSFFRNKTWIYF